MKKRLLELIHSITLRLPQRIALRNGMRVTTYGTSSNSLFWSIFTSSEYLSFVPHLLRLKAYPVVCVDCGAALGYFSLLMEHLTRSGMLPWKKLKYVLVEPMPFNFKRLQFNIKGNLDAEGLHPCVVGRKSGSEQFYFNRLMPWSGSTFKRSNSKAVAIQYFDLTRVLSGDLCVLKLDIEGSEFEFIRTYIDDLEKVLCIVIEWHTERGNREEAMDLITKKGFHMVHRSLDKGNRIVELLVNDKYYV